MSIRIYLVNRNLRPLAHDVDVAVADPDGVVYQHDVMTSNDSANGVPGLYQLTFDFPVLAKEGLWSIKVTVCYAANRRPYVARMPRNLDPINRISSRRSEAL